MARLSSTNARRLTVRTLATPTDWTGHPPSRAAPVECVLERHLPCVAQVASRHERRTTRQVRRLRTYCGWGGSRGADHPGCLHADWLRRGAYQLDHDRVRGASARPRFAGSWLTAPIR